MAFETDKKQAPEMPVKKSVASPKKATPQTSGRKKHVVDVSGVHMTFHDIISALQQHYMTEEEDTTIQMQIYGISEMFNSGDKATAWKHAIKVLGNCIDVDLSQS